MIRNRGFQSISSYHNEGLASFLKPNGANASYSSNESFKSSDTNLATSNIRGSR